MVEQTLSDTVGPIDLNGVPIDRRRYRRAMRFFRAAAFNITLWELVFRRLFGEAFVARGREERTRRYARQFRHLAVEMGGVMIKLGQFLSVRVDVMPDSLIQELVGLQDEVPPEDTGVMIEMLREELGRPIEEVFASIETQTQAAASLGQVYRGRLLNGDRVAIKIQRPNIEQTVLTDLAALRVVAGWLMRLKVVRERADVPKLLDEFAATLWEELDYRAEADNAERFYRLFADNLYVYIPEVYREYSTKRVLVMEDVTTIKVTDLEAIRAAGIDPGVIARRLLDTYLEMLFDFGFFHADPHPGNIFIYPLPREAARKMFNGNHNHPGKPFYLIFVDFGMCGYVRESARAGLREMVIAMGTRDVKRLIGAMQTLGILLPTEHLSELEQAVQETLEYMWGKSPRELAYMSTEELEALAVKYRALLYKLPFQVPQDFIYLGRAVGMLSGLCTALDPQFDPWESSAESARRLLAREMISSADLVETALGLVGQALRRLGSRA